MLTEKNEIKLIHILFWGSLFIRILYVVFLNVNRIADGQDISSIHDDQQTYWLFARAILKDESWLTTPVSFRPPLYPLFLSGITLIFGTGQNFMNIFLVQCLISSLSVVLIYYLAKTIFNRQTAFFSSLWAGIYPLFLYYSGFILGETLVIFLFLLFTLLLLCYVEETRRAVIIFSGVIYALLVHTDPRFIVHLPFIFLYLYIGLKDVGKSAKAYSVFLLVALICSLPWAVRNHITYTDRSVLINTSTLDKWSRKPFENIIREKSSQKQTGDGSINPDSLAIFEEMKEKSILSYMESKRTGKPYQGAPASGALKISHESEVAAFNKGTRPDFGITDLYVHHFIEFWRFARFKPDYNPYPDLRFENIWSSQRNFLGIIFTGILYPFFMLGIFYCFRQRRNYCLIISLIIVVHTVLHVLVHSRERYRMPIEGFLIMIAFYGLLELITKFKIKSKIGGT